MNKLEYAEYLKSSHWAALRAEKRRRARTWIDKKPRCAICGSTEKIDTHHLKYRNIFDVETAGLRLLCRACHTVTHELIKNGPRFKSGSHHGIFAALKTAVKKHRGFGNRNMFKPPH